VRKSRKLIVQVYRNLHLDGVVWSIRIPNGKVLTHAKGVLLRDATFVVQPAGREKVRRERKKTVHAFVKGEMITDPNEIFEECQAITEDNAMSVTYNPYKYDTFVVADKTRDFPEIKSAERIMISSTPEFPQLLATGVTI